MTDLYIRASMLSGYADCPRRAAARSFRELVEEVGYKLNVTLNTIGAIVGTAMHAGAAYSLQEKKKTGEIGNDTEAKEIALENMAQAMLEEPLWDGTAKDKNAAEQQAISLLNVCRSSAIPDIEPKDVEVRLEAKVADGLILTGQADVRLENGIGDFKSGGVRRNNAAQYGAYLLLTRSHGMPAENATEYYIKRVKPGAEQPAPEVHKYDGAAAENAAIGILGHIQSDLKTFRETGNRGAFLANPSSMLCSNKYCPAHGSNFCNEWRK